MIVHVVQAGESLYSIARDYGVNPVQTAMENGISMESTLVIGQTIVIQVPRVLHIVREGQSLESIAAQYGVDRKTIWRNNRWLLGSPTVHVGDVLVISYFNTPAAVLEAGGYAYMQIDPALLQSTLPYLTYLTPFTYGITAEGALLPPADEALLRAAQDYGVFPLLHLSTLTEEGAFSSERAALLLRSAALQQAMAQEVLSTVAKRGYVGADVDFEYVPPELREAYAYFIRLLRQTLNAHGYSLTVALAPKTSAQQRGLLYEAHDYALLGEAANRVFLMTYEWGYTYGPPMAVAPLPQVEQVLQYALTEIPAEKICLGIPTYGYDWPLPFTAGESRAQSLSAEEAVALARRFGAEILYDETARAPWFRYRDDAGLEHEVWFEDARSIEQKLLLAARYGIRGVGYWNLDRPFPQNWPVLNALCRLPL